MIKTINISLQFSNNNIKIWDLLFSWRNNQNKCTQKNTQLLRLKEEEEEEEITRFDQIKNYECERKNNYHVIIWRLYHYMGIWSQKNCLLSAFVLLIIDLNYI